MDDRRSIFVTGAASGMGRATVFRFASEGWFVGGYDVSDAGLASLADEVGAGNGLFERLDVTDPLAFAAAVSRFREAAAGRMDILHNNAGIIAHGLFDEMEWATIERIVRVNLFGPMIGIRAALPLLRDTPNALCFTTCSASAIFGSANLAAYSASKQGVRALTEALSVELARFGIRVGDVIPGIIETAMVSEETKPMFPVDGPWRLMSPESVADAVWDAYHSADEPLHTYVPVELVNYQATASTQPEAVRDEARSRLGMILSTETGHGPSLKLD